MLLIKGCSFHQFLVPLPPHLSLVLVLLLLFEETFLTISIIQKTETIIWFIFFASDNLKGTFLKRYKEIERARAKKREKEKDKWKTLKGSCSFTSAPWPFWCHVHALHDKSEGFITDRSRLLLKTSKVLRSSGETGITGNQHQNQNVRPVTASVTRNLWLISFGIPKVLWVHYQCA